MSAGHVGGEAEILAVHATGADTPLAVLAHGTAVAATAAMARVGDEVDAGALAVRQSVGAGVQAHHE